MLAATLGLVYLASAAIFYYKAAQTAMLVEDNRTNVGSHVELSIVEGGINETTDVPKAA